MRHGSEPVSQAAVPQIGGEQCHPTTYTIWEIVRRGREKVCVLLIMHICLCRFVFVNMQRENGG